MSDRVREWVGERERERLKEKRKNIERVRKGERDEVGRTELDVREKKGN